MNAMLLLVTLVGCGAESPPPEPATPAASAPAVAPGERRDVDVAALRAAGPVKVLDVRTRGEVMGGKVPGAINIPVDDLEARLAELGPPGEQEIYVICKSGGRSAMASDLLASRGYTAVNVKGGMIAWMDAGYPTE